MCLKFFRCKKHSEDVQKVEAAVEEGTAGPEQLQKPANGVSTKRVGHVSIPGSGTGVKTGSGSASK